MEYKEVMAALESMGNAQTKKTLMTHGAVEPLFGVKVADLKTLVKKIKKNHELSLELYDSGNSDAMYLAGLIADENKITKAQLNKWIKAAYWSYLSEYTVPWVASESPHGFELALKWIENKKETIAAGGWGTLSSLATIKPNDELDLKVFKELLNQAKKEIPDAQNRVKYTMNGFVITVASFIPELSDYAIKIANEIGKVSVDVGGTACKVPFAPEYIAKVLGKAGIRKKKKMARC